MSFITIRSIRIPVRRIIKWQHDTEPEYTLPSEQGIVVYLTDPEEVEWFCGADIEDFERQYREAVPSPTGSEP